MSWTLTTKLDTFAGPGEIKRREVVLDHQVSPEEIKSMELGLKAGLLLPQLFPSSGATAGHCLCGSIQHSNWDSNCVVRELLRNGERTLP